MIYAVTGHRPPKLGGYDPAVFARLVAFAVQVLKGLTDCEYVFSGMALGWDMAVAQACVDLGIPFVAAIPFKGQEGKWPLQSRQLYGWLLAQAYEIRYICEPGYEAWKMQERNQWMVDNSDCLIALWNGSSGGTANCVNYASSENKPVKNVWQQWCEFTTKGA